MSSGKAVNNARRRTLLALGRGVTLGAAISVGTLLPRKSEAFVWEIPAAIHSFYELTVGYYDRYVGTWVKKAKELADLFDDDNQLVPAVLTASDAANHVRTAIENNRRKREMQAPPSDQCAAENVDKAAETMNAVKDSQGELRAAAGINEFEQAYRDQMGPGATRNITNHINDQLGKLSLKDALDAMDGAAFAGEEGYLDNELMQNFMLALTAPAKIARVESLSRTYEGVANTATLFARISVAEDALTKIFTRRIASEMFFDDSYADALPYERDILNRIRRPDGLSVVDQERFEVERTHLSKTWQTNVEETTSATALSKELNLVQAFSNALDQRIYEFMEILNTLKGSAALTEMDTFGRSERLDDEVAPIIEEEEDL